jgi:transposase
MTSTCSPTGLRGSTLVHDRLAMYWNYGPGHALCGAHLLRDLNAISQLERHTAWAEQFRHVLCDAKHAADNARANGDTGIDAVTLTRIDAAYHSAVHMAMNTVDDQARSKSERAATNLAGALFDYRHEIMALNGDRADRWNSPPHYPPE